MPSHLFEPLESRSYLSAGDLDPSFGSGGKAFFSVTATANGASIEGLAEEADGKILVATTRELLRFTKAGFIDLTFGDAGRVTPGMTIAGMVLESDNKVLISGGLDGSNVLAVERFDLKRNGAIDIRFGKAGIFSSTILNPSASDTGELAIQRDGKILLNATAYALGTDNILHGLHHLLRLNSNGTLDTRFGRSGEADGSTDLLSTGVAVRKDGMIVAAVGASTAVTYSSRGFLAPLKTPAPVKSAYDPALVATGAQKIAVRPDGMFVYAGDTDPAHPYVSFQGQASPLKFDPNADPSFSVNLPTALAASADNKVIVAGSTFNGWGLQRFGTNQRPDPSFGSGGSVFFSGPDNLAPERLTTTAAGNILGATVVFGNNGDVNQLVIYRFIGGSNPDHAAPTAALIDVPAPVGVTQYFTVAYVDNFAVKSSTIRAANVVVKGPGKFGTRSCTLIGISGGGFDGSPLMATYALKSTSRTGWSAADNGAYSVLLQRKQVGDISGNYANAGAIGIFSVHL